MKLKQAEELAKRTGKTVRNVEGSENVRASITLRIDVETLDKVRAKADSMGMHYQTYMNWLLSQDANGPSGFRPSTLP